MENVEPTDVTENGSDRVTHSQLEQKFATLREEASVRAAEQRQRMQRAADASKLSVTALKKPKPPVAERYESEKAASAAPSSLKVSESEIRSPRQRPLRQNLDLIALWSVVAPSTITAVFAGVAMSSSNVPLPFALMFICAWFAMTSGLALGALKLFNSERFINVHSASATRLGIAAVSCALVSVLAVEAARISITAFAAPPPQQLGAKQKPVASPVRSATFAKVSLPPVSRGPREARAGSVHFPSTPHVIPSAKKLPNLTASIDKTVVSLPAPVVEASPQKTESTTKEPVRPARRTNDELLGRISAKGKFLTHRSSSKWSGNRKSAKRREATPDRRNFLERLFNPVINSANAKAPSRRIRSEPDEASELSR